MGDPEWVERVADRSHTRAGTDAVRMLRNIFRRKLRAFLTIFGISIGVFSLVVMGAHRREAHAARRRRHEVLRRQGRRPAARAGSRASPAAPLKRDACCARSSTCPASRASRRAVSALLDEELGAVNFGTPATIQADDGREQGLRDLRDHATPRAASSRTPTSARWCVGSDLVDQAQRARRRTRRDPRQALRGRRHLGQDAHRAGQRRR